MLRIYSCRENQSSFANMPRETESPRIFLAEILGRRGKYFFDAMPSSAIDSLNQQNVLLAKRLRGGATSKC